MAFYLGLLQTQHQLNNVQALLEQKWVEKHYLKTRHSLAPDRKWNFVLNPGLPSVKRVSMSRISQVTCVYQGLYFKYWIKIFIINSYENYPDLLRYLAHRACAQEWPSQLSYLPV